MGYNTKFEGTLWFTQALTDEQRLHLTSLFGADRRKHPEWNAPKTFYYVDLELTQDENGLQWDGSEKTYGMVGVVNTVIGEMRKVMPEFGLYGKLLAQGEEIADRWYLVINAEGMAEAIPIPTPDPMQQ